MSEWSTDQQKEAAKIAMRVLARKRKISKHRLTRILSHPEKGVYEKSGAAKKVVKELEQNNLYPVKSDSGYLQRTDVEVSG